MRRLKNPVYAWRTDASEHRRPGVIGLGMVLHLSTKPGARGPVVARIAEAYRDVMPGRGESLAIFRALQLSCELGLEHVQIWSDCNGLRKRFRGAIKTGNCSRFGPIDVAILDLAKSIGAVDFRYMPRRRNSTTDGLARHAALKLAPEVLEGELKTLFLRVGPTRHSHHVYPTRGTPEDDSLIRNDALFDEDDDPIPY